MSKSNFVTVGIPTYEAGMSLVKTVESILTQTGFAAVREILIIVDGSTVNPEIEKKLKHRLVRFVYSKKREGQSARINDILKFAEGELVIVTNDDVILSSTLVEEVIKEYNHNAFDFASCRLLPLSPLSFTESVLSFPAYLTNSILDMLDQDNYLFFNGRLIVFTKAFTQHLRIPAEVWNNDAFLYLQSKQKKGKFRFIRNAVTYFRAPSSVKEYYNQSSKFDMSFSENAGYFDKDVIEKHFYVPVDIASKALFFSIIRYPVQGVGYLLLKISKKFNTGKIEKKHTYWETDVSTKNV